MTKIIISKTEKNKLSDFFKNQRQPELVASFMLFLESRHRLKPVLFPRDKTIFQSAEDAIKKLTDEGKLWHEAEIKIIYAPQSVNEETQKVYICPFSGKVFGDNTHPNPQDAIYDWVSHCPENTEREGGLRVKRFFVSDDPEVIKNYIPKGKQKESKTKVVYSSVLSGKLFNSKEAVVKDFRTNYLKPLTLAEVQNQNRFQIEETFLEFIQDQLAEEKITSFVEALAEYEEFLPIVERWVETAE